jgi:CubicO group peptidase (beta-lactamase class C family)
MNKTNSRAIYLVLLVGFPSLLSLSILANAETQVPANSASAITASPHELTPADLEAFFDGMVPNQLEREDIAGAVIAVVKDGKVLLAKGYGYSDRSKLTPVTPEGTLFRVASISKLFVWTSVMQLVERRKLGLDQDVNDYLDFRIPPAFKKPITLRNLLTHTPGFEETVRDESVTGAEQLFPLDKYLKHHIPARIYPAGSVPAYSNYGASLAAYIVQRVSGKPFEQYAAENILQPLGMKRTTFIQPLPDDLKALVSKGYERAQDGAKPFEFVEVFPAGSASSTAMDMCNFMIAHLQNGRFQGAQILRPETAEWMHSRIFGADDRLNGIAHGFYEESANGHRIIGHAGDTRLFHSDLHLILDSDVGLFVSYNSAGKGEVNLRSILLEKFLDRYFQDSRAPSVKVGTAQVDAASVAGFYVSSRHFERSFMKLTNLIEQTKVSANSDGTVSVDSEQKPNGEPKRFEEIAPLLYREVGGHSQLGFRRDSTGRMQFQLDWPVFIFQRVGFFESRYFNYGVLAFGVGVVTLTILWWPLGAVVRKHYGRALELNQWERRARLAVRAVCILFIVFYGGWGLAISQVGEDPAWTNGLPPWVIALGILGVICVLGAIVACLNAVRGVTTQNRNLWSKLHDAVVALACLNLVWFAITWNLVNFNVIKVRAGFRVAVENLYVSLRFFVLVVGANS